MITAIFATGSGIIIGILIAAFIVIGAFESFVGDAKNFWK